MARATENRLACNFGHACHRLASAAVGAPIMLIPAEFYKAVSVPLKHYLFRSRRRLRWVYWSHL